MHTVGIRELRDNLSRYIAKVKEGQTIYVTDHDLPVAQIVPVKGPAEAGITEMLAAGEASWSGRKPQGNPSPPQARGEKTVAEMAAEDRR